MLCINYISINMEKKRIKAMRLLHSKKKTKQTNKQRKGNIHPNIYKIKFHKKMYVCKC